VPSAFLGPETSEVVVTLTRSSRAGAAALRRRLTVWFSEDYTPFPADPAARHSLASHSGVNEDVTFQPGEASLTIPIHVPAVPAGFGSVQVTLGVQRPFMSFNNWPTVTGFTVFASADEVPPTIVATRLTPQGLALTFSKPMDASTVQNINNYDVVGNPPMPALGKTVGNVRLPTPEAVALQAAVYDPMTQTVTLIPTKPLDLASYTVSSPGGWVDRPPTTPSPLILTDLKGNPGVLVGRDLWTA
jgi:hypothetical protein